MAKLDRESEKVLKAIIVSQKISHRLNISVGDFSIYMITKGKIPIATISEILIYLANESYILSRSAEKYPEYILQRKGSIYFKEKWYNIFFSTGKIIWQIFLLVLGAVIGVLLQKYLL